MGGYHSICMMEEVAAEDNTIEFDGERFVLPRSLNFNGQSTFSKVEHAARAFCQRTPASRQGTESPPTTSPCCPA